MHGHTSETLPCSVVDHAACIFAGVVGVDNFNDYYAPSLKRARQAWLKTEGVHVADGDVNDRRLLQKLFETCHFTHVLYLANQVSLLIGRHVLGQGSIVHHCK